LETILRITSEVQLDIVQLHGSEPAEWVLQIPVPVIRVFHLGASQVGVEGITRGGIHNFVLLDSVREDGSGVSGGAGKTVDWNFAKKIAEDGEIVANAYSDKGDVKVNSVADTPPQATKDEDSPTASSDDTSAAVPISASLEQPENPLFPLPIILAGGLNPGNVATAIATVHPWAVDVSGGVENTAGTGKDMDKVKAFINNAKSLGSIPLDNSQLNEISGNEETRSSALDE
jgi:anthranilate synthase/indole-3-glycerol phosphate synthase/phosphoribosylanthranilate isomerase